jgi:predicted CoA-binding protein
MKKNTAIIGASPKQDRYAYMATVSLLRHGHNVFPVGIHEGEISGVKIMTDFPKLENIDTVTLYVGPRNQPAWIDYIMSLHPKRIIFNPGTENDELLHAAKKNGIECVQGCTLVMLSTGQF